MFEALRSGDEAKIGEYSDLNISDTHSRIYSLALKLEEFQETKLSDDKNYHHPNED